jgi:hypothetical protein
VPQLADDDDDLNNVLRTSIPLDNGHSNTVGISLLLYFLTIPNW